MRELDRGGLNDLDEFKQSREKWDFIYTSTSSIFSPLAVFDQYEPHTYEIMSPIIL